jgi:hypothetical protein
MFSMRRGLRAGHIPVFFEPGESSSRWKGAVEPWAEANLVGPFASYLCIQNPTPQKWGSYSVGCVFNSLQSDLVYRAAIVAVKYNRLYGYQGGLYGSRDEGKWPKKSSITQLQAGSGVKNSKAKLSYISLLTTPQ